MCQTDREDSSHQRNPSSQSPQKKKKEKRKERKKQSLSGPSCDDSNAGGGGRSLDVSRLVSMDAGSLLNGLKWILTGLVVRASRVNKMFAILGSILLGLVALVVLVLLWIIISLLPSLFQLWLSRNIKNKKTGKVLSNNNYKFPLGDIAASEIVPCLCPLTCSRCQGLCQRRGLAHQVHPGGRLWLVRVSYVCHVDVVVCVGSFFPLPLSSSPSLCLVDSTTSMQVGAEQL